MPDAPSGRELAPQNRQARARRTLSQNQTKKPKTSPDAVTGKEHQSRHKRLGLKETREYLLVDHYPMGASMANTRVKPEAKPKTKETKEKRPVGRPSSYKSEYAEQAHKLCLLGATDKEMADFFQVTESTFNLWKQEHPEFSESMGNGKIIADAKVAESLYKRATGYTAKKVVTASIGGVITDVKEVDEYIGPDTPAASLWLRNRQPAKWRDKLDLEHAGKDGGPIKTEHTQMPLDPVEAAKAYQRMIQGG